MIVEILGSDMHAQQGHVLATKWNLPDEYRAVVRDHHREPCDANNILLLFVRLVDQVCEKIGVGLHGDPHIALGLGEVALAELEILLEDSAAMANQV